MKAVIITQFGTPSVLNIEERNTPAHQSNEVLVQVKAAGVNRPDVAQRKGHYPAPEGAPKDIPGLEIAGIVKEVGNDVTKWKAGDEVFSLISGGGYAEYVQVHEDLCLPKPKNISFVEAASLPETIYTVWTNVFQRGQLKKGERILIHGGSSGIGITAIQLAKNIGAMPYVTVGSEEKKKACIEIGAVEAVNYKTEDFFNAFEKTGFNLVLDMIGGDYYAKNIELLDVEGRLVYINAIGGMNVTVDIMKIMQKRLTITGSTLRSRELAFKKRLTSEIREQVLPMLESGHFKPVIYQTFKLEDASKAHELMESSEHIGKIVLEVD